LNNPAPRYPVQAFRERAEGTVVLRAEVLPSGQSGRVELQKSSGFKLLDESALATVKQWRFKPAMQDGKPVAQWVTIPITFRLQQR
jgi:protein TonB